MLKRLRFVYPAIAWAVLILILSVIPGKSLPSVSLWELPSFDKIAHMGIYTVLSVLVMLAFLQQYSQKYQRLIILSVALSVTILYGLGLEAVQGLFLTDRDFDIMDILANIIGCLIGTFSIILLYFKNKTT